MGHLLGTGASHARGALPCLLGLALLLGGPARAQDAALRGDARPPARVVEDLVGDDWKSSRSARREVIEIGARVLPELLRARAAAPLDRRVRGPLDDAVREVTHLLADEVGRPLQVAAPRVATAGFLGGFLGAYDLDRPDVTVPTMEARELGDLGSVIAPDPQDQPGRRVRARRARGALALFGPPLTGFLLEVPPLREAEHTWALGTVAHHIYRAEREAILALEDAAAREAFRDRYRGLADLAAPLLAVGLQDPEQAVRAAFQTIRDDALEAALAALADEEPGVRGAAEDVLWRLGHLSLPALLRIAGGGDPAHPSVHAREVAARLARRIRYGLSQELVRRLGHDLAGYDELPFRERRRIALEIERLGGQEGIPALRSLLREEPSDEVRTVAAIGLYRQGDAVGAEWLMRHRSDVSLVRLSNRELAAIHMDQGLRYLMMGRFERAEQEFKRVLEAEPQNEIGWYNLACTYSRWGRIDEAIETLEQAIEHGFDDTSHMAKDPDLDPLREDPRYRALIARLRGAAPEDEPEQPDDDPRSPGGVDR